MANINHSKVKNTGLIFEMLVRQITTESLSGKDSKSVDLIKKYFNKTELAKENKLYQTIIQSISLNESKANLVLNTIIELATKLNREKLNKEKYNLIKEIKNNYDISTFFKTNIDNYKTLASIYTLIESNFIDNPNPSQLISSKSTIIEHICKETPNLDDFIVNELSNLNKGERFLVYKLMVENFNKKYNNFSPLQKFILREYINNINEPDKLKNIINENFQIIKKKLTNNKSFIDNKITSIKLDEVIKMIDGIMESKKFNDEHLISLFQYDELNNEMQKLNGSK